MHAIAEECSGLVGDNRMFSPVPWRMHMATTPNSHSESVISCVSALLPGPELRHDRVVSPDDLERTDGVDGQREPDRRGAQVCVCVCCVCVCV